MNRVIENLKNAGCDVEIALETCMDLEEFYLKMLQKLCNDNHLELLKKAVEEEKVHDAFEASHALKGIYANLGLTPLTIINTYVVETTRHGSLERVPDVVKKLEEKQEAIIQIIND